MTNFGSIKSRDPVSGPNEFFSSTMKLIKTYY